MRTLGAALRYRTAQTVVLAALAALVTACAVLAPLVTRALEQSMLRTAVSAIDPRDQMTTVRKARSDAELDLQPQDLSGVMGAGGHAVHGAPIGMWVNTPRLEVRATPTPTVRVLARDGACRHLTFRAGSCPRKPLEVAVSADDARLHHWRLGTELPVSPSQGSNSYLPDQTGGPDGKPLKIPRPLLTVVGVYEVAPDPAYWGRAVLTGKSGMAVPDGTGMRDLYDDMITTSDTFDAVWSGTEVSLDYPIRMSAVTLASLPTALPPPADGPSVPTAIRGLTPTSPLAQLAPTVAHARDQVRTIVPVLFAQLALLAATALLLVAQSGVEERRPEVALARLRGRSGPAAGRFVVTELATAALLGVPVGVLAGCAAVYLIERTMLPAGVPFEVPAGVPVAVLVAVLVCLVTLALAARPVVREPVSSLLRRLPARRARGAVVLETLLLGVAVFGAIGLATHALSGPMALVTPALLALAVTLVAVRLVAAVADRVGRSDLLAGRVRRGLALTGLARRGTLRRAAAVSAVATSLVVFAANAVAVADANRQARARLEAGAPAALVVSSTSVLPVQQAIAPWGSRAGVVVVARPQGEGAAQTLVASRATMREIAYPVAGQPAWQLDRLAPPSTPVLRLTGTRVTGRVTVQQTITDGWAPLTPAPAGLLTLVVTMPDGQELTRDLARVPGRSAVSVPIDTPLLCPDGCRLAGIGFRVDSSGPVAMDGTITIDGLAVDGRPLTLGGPRDWRGVTGEKPTTTGDPAADQATSTAVSAANLRATSVSTGKVSMTVHNVGSVTTLRRADVADPVPSITSARPKDQGQLEVLGVGDGVVRIRSVQQVPALPVLGDRGALVDLDSMLRQGAQVGGQSQVEVWLADASGPVLDRVREALQDKDIDVTQVRTYAAIKRGYDDSASAWSLRLALLVGGAALAVAALVLVVVAVADWRQRAGDGMALVTAGVPRADVLSAVRVELAAGGVVGALLGIGCGLASAVLAMPLIPLFSAPAAVPALDLTPRPVPVLVAALGCLLLLGAVGWVCGASTGARIRVEQRGGRS